MLLRPLELLLEAALAEEVVVLELPDRPDCSTMNWAPVAMSPSVVYDR